MSYVDSALSSGDAWTCKDCCYCNSTTSDQCAKCNADKPCYLSPVQVAQFCY